MKKINPYTNRYMDTDAWRVALNINPTAMFDSKRSSQRSEEIATYREYADELLLVRQLASAVVIEQLQKITEETRLSTGEWTMAAIASKSKIEPTKLPRMKEPTSGREVEIGPYMLRVDETVYGKMRRRNPEAFYVDLESLYTIGYYFLDQSCQSILFGDDYEPICLPNVYSCLFLQFSNAPKAAAAKIGKGVMTRCKGNISVRGSRTVNGNGTDTNCVTQNRDGSPYDFQKLYVERLRERVEDMCCCADSMFGPDPNYEITRLIRRCFNVEIDSCEEIIQSFLPTKNGMPVGTAGIKPSDPELCTITNLMTLNICMSTAADYFMAPDYTRYSKLLVRTNTPNDNKEVRGFIMGNDTKEILSSLLLVDKKEENDIISSALSDLWLAQYAAAENGSKG